METKVLMVAAEVAPLAKVGGLGDVMGALPPALAEQGVDVAVAMPCYRGVKEQVDPSEVAWIEVPVAGQLVPCTVYSAYMPGSDVPLYLLSHDPYFDRPAIYGEAGGDYPDSLERFTFLCRGALALPEVLGWRPQVVHAHDWHAALIPVYLRANGESAGTRSMLTVHNLAHQGQFPLDRGGITGLPGEWQRVVEQDRRLNLLVGGIRTADMLTTVSPTYARQILKEGEGLEDALRTRQEDLFGVLNGIDPHVWNPASDPHLRATYSAEELAGKAVNKARLQEELELEQNAKAPLIGMVSRLVEQKGFDLVMQALDRIMAMGVQLVVLGTGDPRFERFLKEAQARYPARLGVRIGFSEPLAHRIEAGSDMFLMPSRFEPCGLNQLYSLRYGTVPIVRATGGLADTVHEGESGNGFVFQSYSAEALLAAVERAVGTFREEPRRWTEIVLRGMRGDYTWRASAREYLRLYRRLAEG